MQHSILLRTALVIFCLHLGANGLLAQNTEVRGSVKDRSSGDPIPGTKIILTQKSDTRKLGAIVTNQGTFIVRNVPAGEYTLQASAIGYKVLEQNLVVAVGSSAQIDLKLQQSAVFANEVVVTGQGTATERKRLTTTVESINAKQIDASSARSVDQLLQGRVPGLTSFMPGGLPGTGARMQTRGVKSALTSSNPVIYVDGVRVDAADNFRLAAGEGGLVSSSLADLVTGDIERIEVIKGGAGSTLYGSEAANGVIQIFTKKGTPGDAKWKFSTQQGVDLAEHRFTYEEDTKKYVYQNAYAHLYNLNVNGGNEAVTYNLSGRLSSNSGLIARNSTPNQTYTVAAGLQGRASDKLSFDFTGTYTRNEFKRITLNNSTSPLSDIETESLFQPYSGNPNLQNKDSVMNNYFTPDISERANRFTGAVSVNYNPLPEWTNKFTVGLDYRKSDAKQIFGLNAIPIYGSPSSITRTDREISTLTLNYTGSIDLPSIGDNKEFQHNLAVGAQGFRINDVENLAVGENLAVPTADLDLTATQRVREDARQLFNGGVFVNYKPRLFDRIFFDLGFRYDVNTAFGDKISGQFFPKASASWNIADESFWVGDIKSIISTFKIRASWGQTGNFPPPFTRDKQFIVRSYRDAAAVDFDNPGNLNLSPERTTSIEAGFDMALFEDKLSLVADYFEQVTTDALFDKLNDPATGLGAQQTNLGRILNRGIEASLNGVLIETEDFGLNFRAAFATLENRVLSLGGSAPFSIGGFAFLNLRLEEGYPVGVFRTNVPIRDTTGPNAGQFTGLVQRNVLRGSPTPLFTGSAGFDIRIGANLTMNIFGEFAGGHQIVNQALSRRIVNALALRVPGTGGAATTYPVYPSAAEVVPRNPTTNNPLYDRNTVSDYLLQDATWFKLREISIRYRIPEVLKGLTLSLSGRNLLVITKADVDPETSFIRAGARGGTGSTVDVGGIAGATVSNPRQIRFGIELAW